MPVCAVLFSNNPEQLDCKERLKASQLLEHHHLKTCGRRFKLIAGILKLLELAEQQIQLGRLFGESGNDFADFSNHRGAPGHIRQKNMALIADKRRIDMLKSGGVLFHAVYMHTAFVGKRAFSNIRHGVRQTYIRNFRNHTGGAGHTRNAILWNAVISQF